MPNPDINVPPAGHQLCVLVGAEQWCESKPSLGSPLIVTPFIFTFITLYFYKIYFIAASTCVNYWWLDSRNMCKSSLMITSSCVSTDHFIIYSHLDTCLIQGEWIHTEDGHGNSCSPLNGPRCLWTACKPPGNGHRDTVVKSQVNTPQLKETVRHVNNMSVNLPWSQCCCHRWWSTPSTSQSGSFLCWPKKKDFLFLFSTLS